MNATTNLSNNTTHCLHWEQRPLEVQSKVDETFDAMASRKESGWLFNGADKYGICNVDEHTWFVTLIKKECSQRNNFYAMEIGAGNFSWSKALANTINQDTSLPENITVTILSLRGEQNPDQESIQDGKCHLLNLGAIKIEDLVDTLTHKSYWFQERVDLIISRWTFCHLIDPVGTLDQAFRYLRAETGLLLMDGFFFLYNNQNYEEISHNTKQQRDGNGDDWNLNIVQLFLASRIQFIMKPQLWKEAELHQFALKRKNNQFPNFPLEYEALQCCNPGFMEKHITQFKGNYPDIPNVNMPKPYAEFCNEIGVCGDRNLFQELIPSIPYAIHYLPKFFRILKREEEMQDNLLFDAVLNNNIEHLKAALEVALSVNICDSNGDTPLALCIELDRKEMFDLILQKDPSAVTFATSNGNTPLHVAAQYDKELYFVKKLTEAGADLLHKNQLGMPPYLFAILHHNKGAYDYLWEAEFLNFPKNTSKDS